MIFITVFLNYGAGSAIITSLSSPVTQAAMRTAAAAAHSPQPIAAAANVALRQEPLRRPGAALRVGMVALSVAVVVAG